MAIRIPWDEYETAILISACVDYNAGKCSKKEAIKDVSQILRKRAEKNGIEIIKTKNVRDVLFIACSSLFL